MALVPESSAGLQALRPLTRFCRFGFWLGGMLRGHRGLSQCKKYPASASRFFLVIVVTGQISPARLFTSHFLALWGLAERRFLWSDLGWRCGLGVGLWREA